MTCKLSRCRTRFDPHPALMFQATQSGGRPILELRQAAVDLEPTGLLAREDACRRAHPRIRIQRAGRNDDDTALARNARHLAAAVPAEGHGEVLGVRHLVLNDIAFTAREAKA